MKLASSFRTRGGYRRPARRATPHFSPEADPAHSFFSAPRGATPRLSAESAFLAPREECTAKEENVLHPQEEEEVQSQAEEEEPQPQVEEEEPQPQAEEEEAQPQAEEEEPVEAQGPEEEEPGQARKDGPSAAGSPERLSSPRRVQVDAAVSSARALASRAAGVIHTARLAAGDPDGEPPEALRRYEEWFGMFAPARATFVQSVFEEIARALASDTLCFAPSGHDRWYAHVRKRGLGQKVWLGGLFWNKAGGSGFNSRAGTLVHEMAHHASPWVEDVRYGPSACRSLACASPAAAVRNADSYAFFAEAL